MINELWNAFPRLLVQRINGLLDEAEPSSLKAFHLYKTCQAENLWLGTFKKFSSHLRDFFSLPKAERKKSTFDSFLERPMGVEVFEGFHLTFRTAQVNNKSLIDLASWAHHLVRVGYKTNSVVISEDVFTKTLNYITNPPHFEKDHNIDLEDFCEAWKKIVSRVFGKKYDSELNAILRELYRLNAQIYEADQEAKETGFFPTIYLTQTEIDWTTEVCKAAFAYAPIPKFPLSRGPQKQRLIELQRAIDLYRIVQTATHPDLLKHRENIRTTIMSRCESLLRDKAA
jgi:hypothetical protein